MDVRVSKGDQGGFTLVEALVALVIFGAGVLGIVRLQSVAIQQTSGAGYRSTAALLSRDLISRMWLSDRTAAKLEANFSSTAAGAGYMTWLATVSAAQLPGVASHPPKVKFQVVPGGGVAPMVTITIFWQAPGDGSVVHQYIETAQVR